MRFYLVIFLFIICSISLFAQEVSLSNCIDKAIMTSSELQQASLNFNINKKVEKECFSEFLPSIAFQSYYRLKNDDYPTQTDDLILVSKLPRSLITTFNDKIYDMQFRLEQPLFLFGRLVDNYRVSKLQSELADLEVIKLKDDIKLDVEIAYYTALKYKRFMEIAFDSVNVANEHLEKAEELYKNGRININEFDRAKVKLGNANAQLINASNDYKTALQRLVNLTGGNFEDEIEIEDIVDKPRFSDLNIDSMLSMALGYRIEMAQISLQQNIQKLEKNIQAKNNYPRFFIQASQDWQRAEMDESWNNAWNVLLSCEVKLFDGFDNKAKKEEAKLKIQKLEHTEKIIRQKIDMEVRENYNKLIASKEIMDIQESNMTIAENTVKTVKNEYSLGLISDLALNDTELEFEKAKVSYYQSLYDCYIAIAYFENTNRLSLSDKINIKTYN